MRRGLVYIIGTVIVLGWELVNVFDTEPGGTISEYVWALMGSAPWLGFPIGLGLVGLTVGLVVHSFSRPSRIECATTTVAVDRSADRGQTTNPLDIRDARGGFVVLEHRTISHVACRLAARARAESSTLRGNSFDQPQQCREGFQCDQPPGVSYRR